MIMLLNISAGRQLKPYTWKLAVYSNFNIHIVFRLFHLPCSRRCLKASLRLESTGKTYTHCGNKEPWSITFSTSYCHVKVNQLDTISHGFVFILLYEAIDPQSHTLSIVLHDYLGWTSNGTLSIQFMSFENLYTQTPIIKQAYHFITLAIQTICVQLLHLVQPYIYDGPGTRSRIIHLGKEPGRNISFCFPRFLGYLEHYQNITSKYKTNISWWTQWNTFTKGGDCRETSDSNDEYWETLTASGLYVHCIFRIEILERMESSPQVRPRRPDFFKLQLLSFQGYDMVSEMVHDSICQYGGFYIFYEILDWTRRESIIEDFVSFCKSITNEPEILLPLDVKLRAVYVIFTTFRGYSTGHMMMRYKHQSECKGYHYAFTRCINDGFNRPYIERDGTISHFRGVELIDKTCRIIWIIHNLNDKTRVDHNCTMVNDFKTLRDTYMVGEYESEITNWILPLTHFHESFVDSNHYNFILNATIVKEFPANMNEKQESIIVTQDKIVTQLLPNVRHLVFSTNNSEMDLHGTIIQIRLWEVRVCISDSINKVWKTLPFIYVDAPIHVAADISK